MSLAESSSAGERGQWRAPHNIQTTHKTVTQDVNGGLRGSRTKSPGCASLIVFMACVRQQEILRVQKRLSLTRPALSLNVLAWRAKAAYLLHELTVLPRQCPVQVGPGVPESTPPFTSRKQSSRRLSLHTARYRSGFYGLLNKSMRFFPP